MNPLQPNILLHLPEGIGLKPVSLVGHQPVAAISFLSNSSDMLAA